MPHYPASARGRTTMYNKMEVSGGYNISERGGGGGGPLTVNY